jgi:hypothetical protein
VPFNRRYFVFVFAENNEIVNIKHNVCLFAVRVPIDLDTWIGLRSFEIKIDEDLTCCSNISEALIPPSSGVSKSISLRLLPKILLLYIFDMADKHFITTILCWKVKLQHYKSFDCGVVRMPPI